jgi:outer membrane lipoprotein-sorting protein
VRVLAGETLHTFAQRTGTQVHLLVHHNDRLASATDAVAADTELLVPEYYARRVRLWIDTERALPLQIEVYDSRDRLYERYAYRKLATNVGLTDEHFS